MSTDRRTRAWVEIVSEALRRNLQRVRASVGPAVKLVPMVKADAYGLGVEGVMKAFEPSNPWAFGVATVDEGRELRSLGVSRPIWVLSPTLPETLEVAGDAALTVSVSHLATLERLGDLAPVTVPPAFHLEVDTGMGRAGFPWDDVGPAFEAARRAEAAGARWEGCFTHLHSADEAPGTIEGQWARFQKALEGAGKRRDGLLIHVLNSAGALRSPEYAADAVRPGIFLYGGRVGPGTPDPAEVVAVRARVVHVRDVVPGTSVGYGATYHARDAERWATVSIGYGDGLPRSLGNRGTALVRGRRVPIIGRISMDVTVVDITHAETVEIGDVVTFIGTDGVEHITLDEVAELAGTISYEILTGLTPRLPRIWQESAFKSPGTT